MDRKTKHRILGVFVVIGLLVILFPFFQSKKGVSPETMIVKAPPFPDQSVQVNPPATPPAEQAQPAVTPPSADSDLEPASEADISDQADQADQPDQSKNVLVPKLNNDNEQQPDDTIDMNRSNDLNNTQIPATVLPSTPTPNPVTPPAPTAPQTTAPAESTKSKTSDLSEAGKDESVEPRTAESLVAEDEDAIAPTKTAGVPQKIEKSKKANATTASASNKKKTYAVKKSTSLKKVAHLTKPSHAVKFQSASMKSAPLDKNGLFNLKSPVWVIQLGSFKNKTNALKLVNQLRASGYRAFIQEVNTSMGDSTRVFVGPENKQAFARDIANQLENSLHMHGIIISYKPLAL